MRRELSRRLQVPVVPTVAKSGKGKDELLNTTVTYAERDSQWSPLHISYGPDIDPVLDQDGSSHQRLGISG